jgi:uncharacterized protein
MGYADQPDQIGFLNRIVDTVGPTARIVRHGISLGGATALMLGDNLDLPAQVKAVIDDCGFTSVADEFSYQVGLNHLPAWPAVQFASLLTKLAAGYWFGDADAVTAASHTRLPVFVIHGDADTYNPTRMGKQIYAAVQSPKELWLAPGSGHGESYFQHRAEYQKRITAFYDRYLSE